MTFRTLRRLGAAGAAALFAGCADGPHAPRKPEPGVLTVRLASPNADDRAILVAISGPGAMTSVVSASDALVLHSRVAGGVVRAAAFGPLAEGALLRFAVEDVARSAEYTATVIEASGGDDALRADLSAYRLTVTR